MHALVPGLLTNLLTNESNRDLTDWDCPVWQPRPRSWLRSSARAVLALRLAVADTEEVTGSIPVSPTSNTLIGSRSPQPSSVRQPVSRGPVTTLDGRSSKCVQPHILDLSTSNSAPGEDGSKPCSISSGPPPGFATTTTRGSPRGRPRRRSRR